MTIFTDPGKIPKVLLNGNFYFIFKRNGMMK